MTKKELRSKLRELEIYLDDFRKNMQKDNRKLLKEIIPELMKLLK